MLISQALKDQTNRILNLEEIKKSFDEIYQFLSIQKRFEELRELHTLSLDIYHDGFYFTNATHKFQSLDEVERVLKNKAFL